MIISLVNRTDVPRITDYIRTVNHRAFFSVEEVRYVNEGVFLPMEPGVLSGMFSSVLHPKKRNNCSVEIIFENSEALLGFAPAAAASPQMREVL